MTKKIVIPFIICISISSISSYSSDSESKFEAKIRSVCIELNKLEDTKGNTQQDLIEKLKKLIDWSSNNKKHLQPDDHYLIDLIEGCLVTHPEFQAQEASYTLSSLFRYLNAYSGSYNATTTQKKEPCTPIRQIHIHWEQPIELQSNLSLSNSSTLSKSLHLSKDSQ